MTPVTPSMVVVTGASGSGKKATVRALEARGLSGVHCYYFDAVGVPSAEAMYTLAKNALAADFRVPWELHK